MIIYCLLLKDIRYSEKLISIFIILRFFQEIASLQKKTSNLL